MGESWELGSQLVYSTSSKQEALSHARWKLRTTDQGCPVTSTHEPLHAQPHTLKKQKAKIKRSSHGLLFLLDFIRLL